MTAEPIHLENVFELVESGVNTKTICPISKDFSLSRKLYFNIYRRWALSVFDVYSFRRVKIKLFDNRTHESSCQHAMYLQLSTILMYCPHLHTFWILRSPWTITRVFVWRWFMPRITPLEIYSFTCQSTYIVNKNITAAVRSWPACCWTVASYHRCCHYRDIENGTIWKLGYVTSQLGQLSLSSLRGR